MCLSGLGYCMVFLTMVTSPYYSTIVSWTLFYFGNSFFSPLPWTSCNNWWNTEACYKRDSLGENLNITGNTTSNASLFTNETVVQTSSEEFWE